MKKLLIFLLSIISFTGYGQTVIDPAQAPTTARINVANQEAIVLSGTDAYTATKAGVSYTTDYAYDFKFTNPNTGTTPTINLNPGTGALGAKSIRKKSAGALVSVAANDLFGSMRLRYDGTYFVIDGIGNIGSGSGSATFTGLTDGPGAFTGKSLNFTRVNAGETALEYQTPSQVKTDLSLTKSDVGLSNVDNTSDVNKPVSTAQATADALNLKIASNLSDLNSASTARTNLGLGTLATQSGTFSGTHSGSSSGTNTGDQTTVSGNAGTATALSTGRTIGIVTGDATSSGSSFDGTANNTNSITVTKINGTALSGLATGILKNTTTTGVPSIAVPGDFPTLNQNTTGNAATVTTNANLTGDVTSSGNATSYNNIVPIAKGGTGTASPALVAGTNVTITGSWPNQTVNATGAGVSIASLAETQAGTDNTKMITPLRHASTTSRVFNVTAYSAIGDGKTITDAAITSGTAILTSASALFLSTDAGKYIRVGGAGAAGVELHTTILSYQSATQVTISVNASTTVTSGYVQWGTDNTTPIQNTINAAFAAGSGVVYFPNGYYLVAGALQTSVSGKNPNCQLYIPKMEPNTTQAVTIKFLGESVPNKLRSTSNGAAMIKDGVIIQSTILGTGTRPRVLGTVVSDFTAGFNYAEVEAENITIRTRTKTAGSPIAPTMIAWGMGLSDNFSAVNCVADIECDVYESILPTSSTAIGFETPNINNTQPSGGLLNRCLSQGYYKGFELNEHSLISNSMCVGTLYGFALQAGSHPMYVTSCHSFNTKYDMVFEGNCIIRADAFGCERGIDATRWHYNVYNFYAPSTVTSNGEVKYTSGTPAISGTFGNVFFNDLRMSPRQVVVGGGVYPTVNSSPGCWTGNITPGSGFNKAIFEMRSDISESGNNSFPDFVQTHSQSGTSSVVSRYVVYNALSTNNDKRIIDWEHITNGNTQKGISKFYYGNNTSSSGSSVKEVLNMSSDDIRLNVNSYFGSVATAPTAKIHVAAGTATASTQPVKLTSGPVSTTIVGGEVSFDDAYYLSTTALNRIAVPGKIAGFTTAVSNTSTTETDLFTYTTKASTLAKTDEEIEFTTFGTFNDLTATAQLKFYFAGTSCGDTGALTVSSLTGAFKFVFNVRRTGSTTAIATVDLISSEATISGFPLTTSLTGLTFTNTNIIKVTGTAAGASGGTGDITATTGKIVWSPSSNN